MSRRSLTHSRVLLAICVVFTMAAFASCSKEQKPGSFDDVLGGMMRAQDFDGKKKFLTPGTVDQIDRAVDRGLVARESRARVLPLFDSRTRWEEISRSVRGDMGVLRIRYTAHPVENMIGAQMDLRMVKTGGGWKIDMEKELKDALAGKATDAGSYLEGIKRKY